MYATYYYYYYYYCYYYLLCVKTFVHIPVIILIYTSHPILCDCCTFTTHTWSTPRSELLKCYIVPQQL